MPRELDGYRYVGQIGVGARSTIAQVVRITSGQYFAVKRVVRRSAEDDAFLRQAENEYAVCARIDHPALRRCFELQRRKKWLRTAELLVIMEFVTGKTLEHARPTDLAETIGVFRRVATGLNALHQAGFVHADIKPNNILLTDKREVKIIDFGQSCPIGHKKDRIQGTPDYIAPEQVRRLPLDRRTDVFNLGATLYWVLTERTYPTAIRQTVRPGSHEVVGATRAPKELLPAIPAALSTLVMDCCKDNPDERPPDMPRFIARLDVAEQMWQRAAATALESEPSPPP
ncbi:MAG: serine/threonine protein kinase [Phycisphaerales bacterium]|nr:serine/threonine protein kinase [Phycisphaerales bacterium]